MVYVALEKVEQGGVRISAQKSPRVIRASHSCCTCGSVKSHLRSLCMSSSLISICTSCTVDNFLKKAATEFFRFFPLNT